jgi:hypothetical protein
MLETRILLGIIDRFFQGKCTFLPLFRFH